MGKQLVTLIGGRSDGEIIAVHPAQLQIVETHDCGLRHYAAGEWATPEGPPLVTKLVDYELYRRVDGETFRAVAA